MVEGSSESRRRGCRPPFVLRCVLLAFVAVAGARADTVLLDFGAVGQAAFAGTYDGSSGFKKASAPALRNAGFSIGGTAAIEFFDAGAYNLPGLTNGSASSLLQDFLYSAGSGPAADPVVFNIVGVLPTDTVKLELVGSYQHGARVVFNSVTSDVPVGVDGGAFTSVGQVTGASSYTGSFTKRGGGPGEGNLAGARVTVTHRTPPALTTNLFEFGASGQALYSGTYDGSSGFTDANSGRGVLVAVSPSFAFGPAAACHLDFFNVSAWNNGAGGGDTNLLGQYFYSGGAATNPVPFEIRGLRDTDTLKVEFLGGAGNGAMIALGGVTNVIPAGEAGGIFGYVATLTGATNYAGWFTGAGGAGEGQLSAARLTVMSAPKPQGTLLRVW